MAWPQAARGTGCPWALRSLSWREAGQNRGPRRRARSRGSATGVEPSAAHADGGRDRSPWRRRQGGGLPDGARDAVEAAVLRCMKPVRAEPLSSARGRRPRGEASATSKGSCEILAGSGRSTAARIVCAGLGALLGPGRGELRPCVCLQATCGPPSQRGGDGVFGGRSGTSGPRAPVQVAWWR